MRCLFWEQVAQRLESGGRVCVVMVIDNSAHSPGTRGAQMAVFEDGEQLGTIGGGIMELRALEDAATRLKQPLSLPTITTLHHKSSGPGERSGMICAGQQTNLMMVLDAGHQYAARRAAEVIAADQAAHLIIDHRGHLVLHLDEPSILSRLERDEDGGWRYRAQLLNTRRAAIFGAGHCGLALARQLDMLDYVTSVADHRGELATLRELRAGGYARHLHIIDPITRAAELISYPELTAAIVMTVSYPQDILALRGALTQEFPFIGVMGSPAKIAKIKKELREEHGFDDEALRRLTAPVGLPIQSNTPAEIAVSVAAQLLQLRVG